MIADRSLVRRHLLIAIGIPIVITAIGVVLQALLLPAVPADIAIHWNAAGAPDGFAPAWTNIVVAVGFGSVLPLVLAASVIPAVRRGEGGRMPRFLGAMATWLAVFLHGVGVAALLTQVGITDPRDAESILPGLAISFAVAVLVGGLAWIVLPTLPTATPTQERVEGIALGAGEQAVWLRSASIAGGALVLLAITLVLLIGIAVLCWVMLGPGEVSTWVITGVTLLVTGMVALMLHFHVRVDRHGVTARSAFGVIRQRAAIDEITGVRVVTVSPLAEFGGWGLRFTGTRTGIVTRAGEALEIDRRDRPSLVITVDDATTAAAVLQAALDRRGTVTG